LALGLGHAHRRLHGGDVDLLPALQALVKARQGEAGHLGGRGRTGDPQPVAARHQRYAELALDPVEMLVALTVEQRQQQVVVEFELAAAGSSVSGHYIRRRAAHAATASGEITPARLFGCTASIRTSTMSPIRSSGASACPAWR